MRMTLGLLKLLKRDRQRNLYDRRHSCATCKDGEFDAVFCDKVLIHAGPASAALREMVRVTRASGRAGTIEWLPFFAISPTDLAALTDIINNEKDVGGWPVYASGTPALDSGHDGISDDWKRAHGLPLNTPIANQITSDPAIYRKNEESSARTSCY